MFKISEKEVHEIHKLISKLATCSEYQFEMIEADLNKHHASEKVQNAMDILHAIKLYYVGTEQEANIARVRRLELNIFSSFILAHLLLYVRILQTYVSISIGKGITNGCSAKKHKFAKTLTRILQPIIRLPTNICSLFSI